MALGVGYKIKTLFGKATAEVMKMILPPMVHREDIADAIGYVENAGVPSAVVPDFIGQVLFDTSNTTWYKAFGVSAGNWSALGDPGITAAELDALDGAVAANATTGKAAILGTNGAVQFGGSVTAVGSFIIGNADLSEADMEKLDGITDGAGAASKAMVNDSAGNYTAPDGGYIKPSIATVALAGTGATAADATVIADQNNALTGADGVKGAALPAAAAGLEIRAVNTSLNYPALVWPLSGGNDLINEQEANTPFLVGPREEVVFVATSATQWYVRNAVASAALAPPTQKFTLLEDFFGTWAIGDAGPADTWSTTAGSGTATQVATTVANSINGEVTIKSASDDGATSANSTSITGINLGWKASSGGLAIEARVKIDDITGAAFFVGFTDAISTTVNLPVFLNAADIDSDAADACGVGYDTDGTTAQFFHGGVKGGTDTVPAYSGTAPVNGTYVTLRVEVSAAGAVRGFVNGVAIGVAVANAITAATAVTPCVVVSNRAAAQRVLTIDYIKVEQNRA